MQTPITETLDASFAPACESCIICVNKNFASVNKMLEGKGKANALHLWLISQLY